MKNKLNNTNTITNEEYFTETVDGLNIEANNIEANCITSRNNTFSLDSQGNLSVNSISVNNQSEDNINYETILDRVYPIGSIYLSISNTNPSELFGGTWEKIEDRFLLGAGSTYPLQSIGGTTYHSHLVPNHTHPMGEHSHVLGDSGYADLFYGNSGFTTREVSGVSWLSNLYKNVSGSQSNKNNYEAYGTALGGYTGGMSGTPSTGGSGTIETNNTLLLPPYIAVNIYKRIS